jgi:START domain
MKAFLIFLCFASAYVYGQPTHCNLKKQAEGIKVYTCKTELERFRTLKAEFVIKNTSIVELRNFLLHINNYPTWQYNTIHSEVIQRISDNEIQYVSDIDAPWPVEDRETVIDLKISGEPSQQQMHIEMHTFQSERAVKEGFIRVPFMYGQWNVKRVNDNSLQVEYILQIDPGGSIPAWLVNLAMAEGPYISFKNLKKQLEK